MVLIGRADDKVIPICYRSIMIQKRYALQNVINKAIGRTVMIHI